MTETVSDGPAPDAAKVDPEALVLRGRPRPVVRFRRGLVIGVTAAVAVGLASVAWLALDPPSLRLVGGEGSAGEPRRPGPPDALADAPSDYGEVPRLGPPLPGDLGRAILEHERALEAPSAGRDRLSAADRARAAAEAEREREAAAERAARSSAVMVKLAGAGPSDERIAASGSDGAGPAVADGSSPPIANAAAASDRRPGGARSPTGDTNPHALRPPPSPWTLSAGAIIPASLITGLNSDLPGTVLAQVTENVRDSATGRTVLIPQGARLIGSYDSVVAFGQRRALLVWRRIVFPDGSSLELDNMPATDLAGFSGVEDGVDFHTWRLLKGIGLSTLLGIGTQVGLGGSESDLVRAVRESAQRNAARAGEQITSRNLEVQPTLTVRPGWPLRAIVHTDLVLRPWRM